MGLRERKKLRTRQTIERVALALFAERGYQATTLAQIAEAAEVVPSTLHAYFPSKDDIVFTRLDATCESARRRILERPGGETVVAALQAWLSEDMPRISGADPVAPELRRRVIDGDETLLAQERLRLALLEDVFAEAFARDLGEEGTDLRSRLMAAVAVNGLRAVWLWWGLHRSELPDDPGDPYELDGTYLTSLLEAAERALEGIPSPQQHLRRAAG